MFPKVFTVWGVPALAAVAVLLTAGSGRAPAQARGVAGAHFAGPAPGAASRPPAPGAVSAASRALLPHTPLPHMSYRPSYGSRYYRNYSRPTYPHVRYHPFGYYPLYDPKAQSGAAYHRWDSLYYGGLNFADLADENVYPPSDEDADSVDRSAHVRVTLPKAAKLWFNGSQTTSRGRVRHFRSPALEAGHRYAYRVRARWKKNGRTVTQNRKVVVTAGNYVSLRFPLPRKTKGKPGSTKTMR